MPIILCFAWLRIRHHQLRLRRGDRAGLAVLGFFMEENGIPVAPAILGLVLADVGENFITSLIKADGSLLAFFERPIAGTLGSRRWRCGLCRWACFLPTFPPSSDQIASAHQFRHGAAFVPPADRASCIPGCDGLGPQMA
jgi:hypothetical protein